MEVMHEYQGHGSTFTAKEEKLEVKDVITKHRPHAGGRKGPQMPFVSGDLDLGRLILTFKLVLARDETRLPC